MKTIPKSKLIKRQSIIKQKTGMLNGERVDIIVKICHDDECNNGHNTFSITADIYKAGRRHTDNNWIMGGCCHDAVIKLFPELKQYIKWHLCTSDQPLYYVENTLYHACEKDCWGLKKGEKQQIKNGRTGELCWQLEEHKNIPKYIDSDTKPENPGIVLKYVPWCQVGEGKASELKAARACAIWEDATLEQLQDKKLLQKRLPGLMREFKTAVESLGLIY